MIEKKNGKMAAQRGNRVSRNDHSNESIESSEPNTPLVVKSAGGPTACRLYMYLHFETGRCSDSDGFSARHSSREYGYYEQFRGFRSGPERHYE